LTLKPINENQYELTENTNLAVIDATAMAVAATIQILLHMRNPAAELPGVTSDPSVAAQGDAFFTRRVPAGTSFNDVTFAADMAAMPHPVLPSQNIPVDRYIVGNVTYPANQPFYVRFATPGARIDSPDNVILFYFGGPATSDGSGAYCVAFGGEGYARLYEMDTTSGSVAWHVRDTWRYAEAGKIANASIVIRIWPYKNLTSDGGWIEFKSHLTDYTPVMHRTLGVFGKTQVSHNASEPRTHLTRMNFANGRSDVTGAGNFRIDMRRDLKVNGQVSLSQFPYEGHIIDDPFQVPFLQTTTNPLVLFWEGVFPPNCSIAGTLYNASDDTPLTVVETGTNYAKFAPTPDNCNYYAKFNFGSVDGTNTPYLWDYVVYRDGVIKQTPTKPFFLERIQEINLSGAENDPSHETAYVRLQDPEAKMLILNGRAGMAARIDVIDSRDNTGTCLFRGFLMRATAKRKGALGITFPTPNWREYECEFAGEWQRLSEQYLTLWVNLGEDKDRSVPAGTPMKITDAAKLFLSYAGYTDDQIDVPDNPMRFWPPSEGSVSLAVSPLTAIGDWLVQNLRDYLGWFLVYDPNFGGKGGWRARQPQTPPYVNVAQFVTTPAPGRAPMVLDSYRDYPLPTSPIRRSTLHTYVKPPEANAVYVTGTGTLVAPVEGQYKYGNWMINQASLDTPTFSDGSINPDFLGRLVPLFIVDPGLNGVNADIAQAAVDWVTRRYYDFVCHGIKVATFEAPLLFVPDQDNGGLRNLRYYDPVMIHDGISNTYSQWLIRNVNPFYHKDHIQMARYELESPRIPG
jgi:hypothetical protein